MSLCYSPILPISLTIRNISLGSEARLIPVYLSHSSSGKLQTPSPSKTLLAHLVASPSFLVFAQVKAMKDSSQDRVAQQTRGKLLGNGCFQPGNDWKMSPSGTQSGHGRDMTWKHFLAVPALRKFPELNNMKTIIHLESAKFGSQATIPVLSWNLVILQIIINNPCMVLQALYWGHCLPSLIQAFLTPQRILVLEAAVFYVEVSSREKILHCNIDAHDERMVNSYITTMGPS
eukprot:Gb_30181 [translate_table: standard]